MGTGTGTGTGGAVVRLLVCLWLSLLAVWSRAGDWTVTHLDDRTLALTGDYSRQLAQASQARWSAWSALVSRVVPRWETELRRDIEPARAILEHRPALVRLFRDAPQVRVEGTTPVEAVQVGFWLSPTGLLRLEGVPTRNAEVAYHLFVRLSRPLKPAETVLLTLPDGTRVSHRHEPGERPSALFKLNQVGYALQARRRYAYLGAWLGTAGPLPLRHLDGRPFELRRASDASVAFTGTLRARMDDPKSDQGTPFTGEETLELDFSAWNTPGDYFLWVDGIGRSETFALTPDALAEAFYVHARGLFHKRCGIERRPPFTHWPLAACHQRVRRGSFPPHADHYGDGNPKRDFGFYDAIGKSLKVHHFQLIAENPPRDASDILAPGGWHDAADYDRRPMHLQIVGDLAAVYLLRPQNFSDGQLNLPESGNGIPDILDECIWGLSHLRAVQQRDGGVGTWFETVRHPVAGEGVPAEDTCTYYVSTATRASSLEYAAYAALLAVALQRAGADAESRAFAASARRAWDFAMRRENRAIRVYSLNRRTVFYREPPELEPELLVKAGLSLAHLFGASDYLAPARQLGRRALDAWHKGAWRRSPLFWLELQLFPQEAEQLAELRQEWRQTLLREAERLLRQQEQNYPYRIAWHGVGEGWVHTMAWGNVHPLRRARTLVAAHAVTGDRRFLDAAFLASDFHHGANPSGICMTSGLGTRYPVRFLDLPSYADGIAEFVPGITPYRHTYGIDRGDVQLAHGLFLKSRTVLGFDGAAVSLLPREGLTEQQCAEELGKVWPIWRRWPNVEQYSVASSEYSVWETIGPAAAVTGYLLDRAHPPRQAWLDRRPAADIRQLPGYAPLP